MVTGDHPITAKSIARMVGIISSGNIPLYSLSLQNIQALLVLCVCTCIAYFLGSATPDEIKDPNME